MKQKIYKYSLYSFLIIYALLSLMLQYGEMPAVVQRHTIWEYAKYALLPSLLVGCVSGWIYGHFILNNVLSLKPLFLAVLSSIFLIIMAEPYLAAVNRNFGKQEKATIEGTITRKYFAFASHEHAKRKIIEILDHKGKKTVQFEVNMPIFQSSSPGNEFRRNFQRGCLGWYY